MEELNELIRAMFSILGFGIGCVIDAKCDCERLKGINRKVGFINQYTGNKFAFQLTKNTGRIYTIESTHKPHITIQYITDNNGIVKDLFVW